MALSFPSPGAAQGFALSGRVLKVQGSDSTPLARAWAVLHRITNENGTALDSTLTDSRGRYRLRVALPDSGAVYVVSISHQGVAYFTAPVRASRDSSLRLDPIAVYDTSSASPPIELRERHLILRRPEGGRGHRVLEILVLANRGTATRIASDTSHPVWQMSLPRGAIGLEVGASDVNYQTVYRRGDSVAVAAPIPPGEKQILITYFLTQSKLELTLDQPVGRFNLLAEDSTARLLAGPLENLGTQELQGLRFARFAGDGLAPGAEVILQMGSGGFSPTDWWWLVVALAGVALLTALIGRWPARLSAASLEAQLRAIDAALTQAPGDLPPEELKAYRRRKAQLERLLRPSDQAPP